MTVFSIVFGNYGKFVPKWNDCLDKQTVPVKKLLILGLNHGADLGYLKDNQIEYLIEDTDKISLLLNKGIELIQTERYLFFSIDDELYPHACEEIMNINAEAVSLKFDYKDTKRDSVLISSDDEINNYKTRFFLEGWVALKKKIYYREDLTVPFWVYLFDIYRENLTTSQTTSVVARHNYREDSLGVKSGVNGDYKKYNEENDKYL